MWPHFGCIELRVSLQCEGSTRREPCQKAWNLAQKEVPSLSAYVNPSIQISFYRNRQKQWYKIGFQWQVEVKLFNIYLPWNVFKNQMQVGTYWPRYFLSQWSCFLVQSHIQINSMAACSNFRLIQCLQLPNCFHMARWPDGIHKKYVPLH